MTSDATNITIMVVDDSRENLRLLDTMLRRAGYIIRLAPNGILALRAIDASPPNLVLLDINMPEMDGLQVCQRIKTDEKHASIPVIFMSGSFSNIEKQKIQEVGGAALLAKPFGLKDLLSIIEEHLPKTTTKS